MTEAKQECARRLAEISTVPGMAIEKHVLKRLSAGEDAKSAWSYFKPNQTGAVIGRVRAAFEHTAKEYGLPQKSHEQEDIERVIQLAQELKRAVKSTMPGDTARTDYIVLDAAELPDVPIELGWHSLRPGGYGIGYPLAVEEVLDWAIDLAEQHLKNRPLRSVARAAKDTDRAPEITMFVRHLDWQFRREFGQGKPTAIAHFANALFMPETPIGKRDVEVRLRASPLKNTT